MTVWPVAGFVVYEDDTVVVWKLHTAQRSSAWVQGCRVAAWAASDESKAPRGTIGCEFSKNNLNFPAPWR